MFDAEVDPKWREELWQLVRGTPHLDWLILTKRPENFGRMLPPDWGDGWPNVCLMTSVEDQLRASRIDQLIATPAKYRALSVEPLLGPVKLKPQWLRKLNWIIVGGESGHGARPMQPQWVRGIRDQCEASGVKFLFKQWGCWSPDETLAKEDLSNAIHFAGAGDMKPTCLEKMDITARRRFQAATKGGTWMFRTSKGIAGNFLDGRQHLAHPFGKRIPKSELVVTLNPGERKRLRDCEQTIRAGLGTFIEVGIALMEIRNSKLYRGTHRTFEDYAQSVLSLTRPHAYRLMDSAQVVRDLSPIGDISLLPTNEAQARELVRIKTAAERVAAWRKVIGATGDEPLTAKRVRETLFPRKVSATDDGQDRAQKIRPLVARLRRLFQDSNVQAEAGKLLGRLEDLAVAGRPAQRRAPIGRTAGGDCH